MAITTDQLATIPEVYRDFMLTLKPILDSRNPGVILRMNGIHFGTVYEAIASRHDYDLDQVRELAHNLAARGWIVEDKFGFFTPTAKGEEMIRAFASEAIPSRVPPLPAI